MKNTFFLIIASIIVFSGCHKKDSDDSLAASSQPHPIISALQKKYAPDRRIAIFTVNAIDYGTKIILIGDVESGEAKEDALAQFKSSGADIIDSIEVLPAENIGERSWGIITVSVANMRSEPKESAELGSQVLMGNVVRIWKKKGGYVYIQSPDRYLGWADPDQLHRVTREEAEQWNTAKKLFVTALVDHILEKPEDGSFPVCDVVGGAVLLNKGEIGTWVKVGLADGRTGFIKKTNVMDYAQWGTSLRPVAENIERTGRFLMGVPYLWGGTSVKGVDCSGFTKTVYLLNGVSLNRDANQQADQGTPVEPGKNFENLKKGDLLFFGRKAAEGKNERIVHVGIYLGNKNYIHSSGSVQINSFDERSPLFNEYNLQRFVRARRVIASAPLASEVKTN